MRSLSSEYNRGRGKVHFTVAAETDVGTTKEINQDSANGKKTVVDILGIEKSIEYASKLESSAIADIEKYGKRSEKLIALCKYLSRRLN